MPIGVVVSIDCDQFFQYRMLLWALKKMIINEYVWEFQIMKCLIGLKDELTVSYSALLEIMLMKITFISIPLTLPSIINVIAHVSTLLSVVTYYFETPFFSSDQIISASFAGIG